MASRGTDVDARTLVPGDLILLYQEIPEPAIIISVEWHNDYEQEILLLSTGRGIFSWTLVMTNRSIIARLIAHGECSDAQTCGMMEP